MRKNGFQKPFNGMQISTWVFVPLLLIHFFTCLTPTLPLVFSAPLTAAFVFSAIVSIYNGYVTTATDAIDHLLFKHKFGYSHPSFKPTTTTPGSEDEEENNTKYCWVCQTNVYVQSMHCKYCDKCVNVFDHHCMWLNTCIGSENYKTFFQTVVWTFIFITIHVAAISLQLGLYFVKDANVRRLAGKWFDADRSIILVGLNIGMLVFCATSAFMVLQLLVFHLGLKREGLTTYQYIVRDTAQKRDKSILTSKVRERRVEELKNAGSTGEAFLLKMGGFACCKSCDPIHKLVQEEMEQQAAQEQQDVNFAH